MVDFIWRFAAERHVRAMAVVPSSHRMEISQECSSSQRYQRHPCDVLLERQDQSLNHGNAAVFTNRAEPRLDFLPPAPWFKLIARELGTLIADQMPGLCSCRVDHAAQERSHRLRRRLLHEKSDAHDPPCVMVYYDAKRQRELALHRDISDRHDDRFSGNGSMETVRQSVQELPDSYREVVVLRYFSGLSYEEIAATLNISARAVNGRLTRAKYKLAERLRRNGFGKVGLAPLSRPFSWRNKIDLGPRFWGD